VECCCNDGDSLDVAGISDGAAVGQLDGFDYLAIGCEVSLVSVARGLNALGVSLGSDVFCSCSPECF
jgi:hypothetical protein